jgi:spore photoproduct lyase
LALDHLTENSKVLISRFRNLRKAILELKTKTTNIDNVLEQEPAPNIVISWSLNTPKMAQEHESGAPSVEQRLKAAKKIVHHGFRVGFHFDPLIRYPGWEKDYDGIIRFLFEAIDPERIAWISLGSLRFPPNFVSIINSRFPTAKIFHDEFIRGRDGKYRYFKPLRLELYNRVVHSIRKIAAADVPLYFCMESEDVWGEVLKKMPQNEQEVEDSLTHPTANLEE